MEIRFRVRRGAPDAQLVLARRDEMIAIGCKGQLEHLILVPLEQHQLLVRNDIPNRNPPIGGSGGEPATITGKRDAREQACSWIQLAGLATSSDIPKAKVRAAGGDKRLSIGQQRQPTFYWPIMAKKCDGSASWSVELPQLDSFPEAGHERLAIG